MPLAKNCMIRIWSAPLIRSTCSHSRLSPRRVASRTSASWHAVDHICSCICSIVRLSSSSLYARPMAASASSPVSPAPAVSNMASSCSWHRSMVARKIAFFDGKSRKRYGWDTPTRRAIASVDAPCSPFAPNSIWAAFSTISRRCAADIRPPVAIGPKVSD